MECEVVRIVVEEVGIRWPWGEITRVEYGLDAITSWVQP